MEANRGGGAAVSCLPGGVRHDVRALLGGHGGGDICDAAFVNELPLQPAFDVTPGSTPDAVVLTRDCVGVDNNGEDNGDVTVFGAPMAQRQSHVPAGQDAVRAAAFGSGRRRRRHDAPVRDVPSPSPSRHPRRTLTAVLIPALPERTRRRVWLKPRLFVPLPLSSRRRAGRPWSVAELLCPG